MKIHQRVNVKLLFYALSFCFINSIYSQDLLMQNGTVNTCSGNFYDSGGPNGTYGNNEDLVYTICPDIPDYKLRVEFIEIAITTAGSGGSEELTVYDGTDTFSSIITILDVNDNIDVNGTSINIVATETNASGCLTFRFTSDPFFSNSGWEAIVSCIEECQDTTASLLQIVPSSLNTSTNNYDVSIFETINFEIDPVFTNNNGNNPEYIWDFGDGTAPVVSNTPEISHIFESFGIYTVSVSIIDDFGCTNDDVLEIPVEVITPSGSFCSEARQICPVTILPNFNTDNGGLVNAETGPDYGCLGNQPYPSWFYFQVENSGDIALLIEQKTDVDFSGANLDADFKLWGPFNSLSGSCTNLNASTEVADLPNGDLFDGCSYSAAPVENMGVQNAQAGEYYIFVTTNFSQQQGFIRISQINSTDSSAGSISCDDTEFLGDDITTCSNDPVTIASSIGNADAYQWEIFNSQTNTFEVIPGEQSSSLTVTAPGGTYRSTVTIGSDVFQDEINITFLELPDPPLIELIVCDDESIDFPSFDLTTVIPQIVAGLNDSFTITFHESLSDATSGQNPIANPNSYTNIVNPQTIYFRAENQADTDCFSTGPIDLIVDDCLSINDSRLTSSDFTVYPNPSKDRKLFIVSEKLANSQSDLKIIDLNGKVVYRNKIEYDSSGRAYVNLSKLVSGIYLGLIENDKSPIVTKIILR